MKSLLKYIELQFYSEFENWCVPNCDVMSLGKQLATFRGVIAPSSSGKYSSLFLHCCPVSCPEVYRSPWRLNFVRWRRIFFVSEYGTCFVSAFLRLECRDGSRNFWKKKNSCTPDHVNRYGARDVKARLSKTEKKKSRTEKFHNFSSSPVALTVGWTVPVQ